MEINKEIRKIVEYQNSVLPTHERRSKENIDETIEKICKEYKEKTYDFSDYTNVPLRQVDKIRNVKQYQPFSSEEVLCIYLKRLLDKTFHITYPNRNVFMRTTFDIINSLKDMGDYTVFRFDFADFFNSISSTYVFEKYVKEKVMERYQTELIQDFVDKTRYAYAGLNTSNIFCEIIAKKFDEKLIQKFNQSGVILYKRYIDDGLIIFNRYISNDECLEIIDEAIQEVFYDKSLSGVTKCKTKLNLSKVKYIAKRNIAQGGNEEFDFLGYKFVLSIKNNGKTVFQYGITQKKIDKYTKRINNIVKAYVEADVKNMNLLRHQIKAFSCRTVYQVNRYKSTIWKSKGFISNYCELRYRMDRLTPETKKFLQDVIIKAFVNNGIRPAYFMRGNKQESSYNLYNNMANYRTLLFVEMIGISYLTLKKMCEQIGINIKDNTSYTELVREYLIKVKVGH